MTWNHVRCARSSDFTQFCLQTQDVLGTSDPRNPPEEDPLVTLCCCRGRRGTQKQLTRQLSGVSSHLGNESFLKVSSSQHQSMVLYLNKGIWMRMQAAADTPSNIDIAMLMNDSDNYACIPFPNIRLNLLAWLFSCYSYLRHLKRPDAQKTLFLFKTVETLRLQRAAMSADQLVCANGCINNSRDEHAYACV